MYIDDIKVFTNNKKELETLIQTIRIYSHDIGMEFSIVPFWLWKVGKEKN